MLALWGCGSDRRMALPTPAHEKKREANQCGTRRREEEKAEPAEPAVAHASVEPNRIE